MPKRHTLFPLGLLFLATLILGFLTDTTMQRGLDADRYSFAESLVERETFLVAGSSMQSVDWIRINGEFYSGKPPVLNFLGAGLYALLHHGLDLNFRTNGPTVVRAFVWTFCLLPSLLSLVLLWRMLRRAPRPLRCSPNQATGLTALIGLTTLVPAYATVFTNHPLAMLLLLLALNSVLVQRPGQLPKDTALAWAGFWATLSATIDLLPGTFFVAGLSLSLLWAPADNRSQSAYRLFGHGWFRRNLWLAAGCLPPALLHLVLNRITLGTWTLPYLIPGAFDYEGSVFIDANISPDYPQYPTFLSGLLHYSVGHRGALWITPLLFLALAGSVALLWRKVRARFLLYPIVATFTALLATLILVPKFSMGLAGGTYGNRHLLPAVLAVLFFLPLTVYLRPLLGRLLPGVISILAVWSSLIAFLGLCNPWTPHTMSVFAPVEVLIQITVRFGRQPWAEFLASRTAANPSFGYAEYANHLWQANHLPAAISCLRESVRLQPDRVQSWYNLGTIEGRLGRDEEAIQAFAQVVRIEPSNSGAWANLSLSLSNLGRDQATYEASGRALALNPDSRAALTARARAAANLGRMDEATTTADRLFRLHGVTP